MVFVRQRPAEGHSRRAFCGARRNSVDLNRFGMVSFDRAMRVLSHSFWSRMGTLATERMSDLIGMIYDCAIEPNRWPRTIAEICRTIGCLSGMILLIDLRRSQHRLAYAWGMAPEWERRFLNYSDALTGFYARAFSKAICLDGEPLVLSSVISGARAQSIYAELTEPEGISDAMQTVVLRQAGRLAVFGANRHESTGTLTDDERTIMRLLVPHIRRAVSISDLLDVKNIEIATLAATLDSFNAGILVVGDRAHILHANRAARDMLSKREPIAAVNGILSIRDARAGFEIANAIELARVDEAMIGTNGIGVPLRNEGSAVAHVLPLTRGDLRTRLAPQATAAVFITQPADSPPEDIGAIAANFDLTPAEARMLECLAGGATLSETAETLDISANTARTHLARIFSKTGVTRQADLIALVNRIVPPVHRPRN
jgi:DNA-binding CsgD family transcriptional regulator/PAS domain-containing protein